MGKDRKRKSRISSRQRITVLLSRIIFTGFFVLGTVFFLSGCQTTSKEEAKYVFVFLGDGMGINQVASTRYWEAQEEGQSGEESIWKKESFDSFPVTGFMSTHNMELGVTDSAASATAIFSGKKTKNGFLNYNPETEEAYTPFAKKLKESGYAVGVISTTSLNTLLRQPYMQMRKTVISMRKLRVRELPVGGWISGRQAGFTERKKCFSGKQKIMDLQLQERWKN